MILDRRLIAADVLKLRRRPRTLVPNALLAVAFVAFMFFAQKGIGYPDIVGIVATVCVVVGVNIGSLAGAQDREAGVLRDLFATGRSRLALYVSRIAGAASISLLLVIPAVTLSIVLSQVVWQSVDVPGADQVVPGVAAALAGTLLGVAGGVGLAGLVSSRAAVTAMLTAWYLAVSPLLENVKVLGDARGLLPSLALKRFGDVPGLQVHVAYVAAIGVLLLWAAAPLLLGARRENGREI